MEKGSRFTLIEVGRHVKTRGSVFLRSQRRIGIRRKNLGVYNLRWDGELRDKKIFHAILMLADDWWWCPNSVK